MKYYLVNAMMILARKTIINYNGLEFYFQIKGERGIPGPSGTAVCTELVCIV